MKFRVTGALKDGTPFDRVMEAPDEATVRRYANQNGVTVSSVEPHVVHPPVSGTYVTDHLSVLAFIFGVIALMLGGFLFLGVLLGERGLSIYVNWLLTTGLALWLIAAIRDTGRAVIRALKDR